MNRWRQISTDFAKNLKLWQMVYMVIFAAYSTFANLYIGSNRVQGLMTVLYLLLSVGSLIIVLPNFRASLFRVADPLRTRKTQLSRRAKSGWRLYLYFLLPAFFVALLQLFSAVSSAFLSFDQTNVPSQPTAGSYITPVLAGMEEVWRWSVIGTVIVILKGIFKFLWFKHSWVRMSVFALGVIVSSFAFGSAHILEFSSHRVRALFLFSGLGALLAFMTIVTGRILLVMCVHIAYDMWVTTLSAVHGYDVMLGFVVYVALFAAPLVTMIWRKKIFAIEESSAGVGAIGRLRSDQNIRSSSNRDFSNYVQTLVPFQVTWADIYEREADVVSTVFSTRKDLQIAHIGSTAVEGTIGSGVIDILVRVKDTQLKSVEKQQLIARNYVSLGQVDVPGRHLFLRRSNGTSILIHLVASDNRFVQASLVIRAFLETDGFAKVWFGDELTRIVQKGHTDFRSYTLAKHSLFEHLYHRAQSDPRLPSSD